MKTVELKTKAQNPNFGKIPKEPNKDILHLADPHIDSFNFLLDEGLMAAVRNAHPMQLKLLNGDRIHISVQDVELSKPKYINESGECTKLLYPKECIESKGTYAGLLMGTLLWKVNGVVQAPIPFDMGKVPIMVKSKKCNLYGMNPGELVKHGEIVNDPGGYFIVNGSCKILRLLVANRRNYPMILNRKSWKLRDADFSEKGVLIRCVTKDQTSALNVLHHLKTGGVKLEFQIDLELFFIPLVLLLKALMEYSDRLIYLHLVRGREKDHYYIEKIKMMLRELQEKKLYDKQTCQAYIGKTFRLKLEKYCTTLAKDEEVCYFLMDNYVLPHIETDKEKFDTLCMMSRKLFSAIAGECNLESADVVSMQEASLGGFVYLQYLKGLISLVLNKLRMAVVAKNKEVGESYEINFVDLKNVVRNVSRIGDHITSFLATGTVNSKVHCGLMQRTGLSIVMDRLNRMRDLSHLRAIHRGSHFVEQKTIEPRKLTGEAWGFICPVHTPDGAPCGLLNHLSFHCVVACESINSRNVEKVLFDLGMSSVDVEPIVPYHQCLEVILDGYHVGYIPEKKARDFTDKLRALKVTKMIPEYTEIVLNEQKEDARGSQYPALYLFTTPARLMRPVINLALKTREYIGTMEQLNLNIAITPDDIEEGVHTHMEIEKTSMLSNIGKLVPFSDCNPNPRNMYQCQMGKQTMGTPIHNWTSQTYHKLYRLQYPQIPLVRNAHYDKINMEEFCMGFNAVLAVISYTGYDMEDAMIINKCAMERGLGHGQVYKSEVINLKLFTKTRVHQIVHLFQRNPNEPHLEKFLDEKGLPYIGIHLTAGDPFYCSYNIDQGDYYVSKYKGEDCIIDKISLVGEPEKDEVLQKVIITLRVNRNPNIGDKFASRSGQKGIMSRLYPMEDLPFSERGIVPDIIFNPHGIPSRMTAGTLIDLIAGKCGAEFGKSFDSTPFEFSDENPAFDYFGKILEKAGFNYYGEDILYSGTDGRMMEVEIFEGIIYYQRLRHMTADKWQVRSTGLRDKKTHQPVKGRKRGGAIRFGEMERDCLISHGAAFILKDRLLDCSDKSEAYLCTKCGSFTSPILKATNVKQIKSHYECSICGPDAEIRRIFVPYAFQYLVHELMCVGIKTQLGVKSSEQFTRAGLYPNVQIKKEEETK